MKPTSAFSLILLTGIAAFLLGSRTSAGNSRSDSGKINTRTTSSRAATPGVEKDKEDSSVKARSGRDVLSAGTAGRLSAAERIALLKKAAVLGDAAKQADILCGLISVMTEGELLESTKTLLEVQRRGNVWSPAVWDTLWTQWGRVNAEGCLALSKTGEGYPGWNGLNGLNTPNDYRCMMAGWMEANPEAALAWARKPKDNMREATAAAFAITSSAKGDLKQMEAAITAVSADTETTKACLTDYLDLAVSSGDHPSTAAVYDTISPSLKAAAWPMVMERLAYTDPQSAAAWLAKHAADPGSDYRSTYRLVSGLSRSDPEGTAKWAAALPVSESNTDPRDPRSIHPAVRAINGWMSRDPVAAEAWVKTLPPTTPWLGQIEIIHMEITR